MEIKSHKGVVDAGVELPELVVCAAQRFDNIVIPSVRHFCTAFWVVCDKLLESGVSLEDAREIEEGFITNRGRFVIREEAYVIAKENNQIRRLCPTGSSKLYSEMLY